MWRNSKKNRSTGFTLVEVIISLGIMVGMLSYVALNQSTYTGTAALNNSADGIYLFLRQAQVYGVGVKEFTPGSDEFNVSYGISFNTSSSGSEDAYIFFADRGVLNQRYDSGWACPTGASSECISKTTFTHNNRISKVCYIRNNNTEFCSLGGVDVTFARPDTRANLRFFNSAGNTLPVPNLKAAKIELTSPNGLVRTIHVYKTGQVSVE